MRMRLPSKASSLLLILIHFSRLIFERSKTRDSLDGDETLGGEVEIKVS